MMVRQAANNLLDNPEYPRVTCGIDHMPVLPVNLNRHQERCQIPNPPIAIYLTEAAADSRCP
jgi:hypothetical protein